jgi:hypothetical protein
MFEVNEEIDKLLSNKQELEKLLFIEKERRGFEKNKLVFIGMANISSYYWCSIKSLLKSKKDELGFFHAYLHDRICYSLELGYIKEIPKRIDKEILEIGNEINFNDIEKPLKIEESLFNSLKREEKKKGVIVSLRMRKENGSKEALVNPELSLKLKSIKEGRLKKEGYKIVNLEEEPMLKGHYYENKRK